MLLSAWRLWLGFALVLGVLLGAMGWMTVTAVRLDRAEAATRHQAHIEENVRLALWRMDSALAPLLAQENAHPYYRPHPPLLTPTSNPQERIFSATQRPTFARGDRPHILLRFQSPAEAARDRSTNADATPSGELASRVPLETLSHRLDGTAAHGPAVGPTGAFQSLDVAAVVQPTPSRAATEFQQRNRALLMNNQLVQQLQQSTEPELPLDSLTAVWVADEMLLARRIEAAGKPRIQGCLLDWPAMQQWLLGLCIDLLPEAQLQPLEAFDSAGEPGLLAALPVRLIPGRLPVEVREVSSAIPRMLALAWVAVLLSAIIGGVMVHGVVRLSLRREAFVSAVTHELRTPLTTFRMYTEMLAQGMVQDTHSQREYLLTLRDQSLRLSHLVENVLAYARLERGRGETSLERMPLADLLEPILPRLVQQATAAGMELVVHDGESEDLVVQASPSAVEQILINLVDNACKYAQSAEDRRIVLAVKPEGRYVAVQVRDFGPGLPQKRRAFQVFRKSAEEAARSAPGVGLGLGLSRQLAEQMGGHLEVDARVTDGAALILRLRAASLSNR